MDFGKRHLNYGHRGDPDTYDFIDTDLTTDGDWHDLDLSSIVPVGTKLVQVAVVLRANLGQLYFHMRKNGQTTNYNLFEFCTQVSNYYNHADGWVACDSDRKVEYKTSNWAFSTCNITIRGWLI